MRKISVRIPDDVLAAIEESDVNRSEFIRRVVNDHVADGDLDIPDDLQTLAERETVVDKGRLPRKRATFRSRMYDFFADKWKNGAVTATDARELGESWLSEAGIYGPEYVRFAEALLEWYDENWEIGDRTDWPDADVFHARAGDVELNTPDRLISTVKNAAAQGAPPDAVKERLRGSYHAGEIENAIEQVYESKDTPTP